MKSIPRLLLVCLLALVFFAFAAAEEPLSLPEGLRIIEEEAFADCESLSGVLVIPLSVQVDGSAFSNTPGLTVIRGIAVIGDEAEPSGGTLDWDVMTAVSAFCVERNIDFFYTSNAEDALNAGYNAIVTVGFMATDAVNALQTQYPDARFICLDSEVDNQQDNVCCVLYNTEQSGFMAGYAAVRMGYRSLGFLGGIPIPDVVGFGDGFILGASQAAAELEITDEVTVVSAYTYTFAPEPKVYQKAASWYGRGVELIFCCGGSMCQAAVRAANESSGLMIGVDTDQSNLGSAVVTSAMKNMGFSATDALARLLNGGWDSLGGTCSRLGVISGVPAENHVCLAPSTQFGTGFAQADYAELAARLYSGAYPSGGIGITVTSEEEEEPIIVSSAADLQELGDTLSGTIIVISVDDAPVDLSWPVTLEGELQVETGDSHFSSLRICEGGSLTLAEGSVVRTLSSWDPVTNTPSAIAQVWVDGGTLDASLGTVEDYSTVYIRSGSVLLAEGADGIYLIGGAMSADALYTFLSDPRLDELFLEADMTLSSDVTLPCNTQIQSGAAVTVGSGATLTVSSGCVLNIMDGTLTIAPQGNLIVEDGAEVYGNVQRE